MGDQGMGAGWSGESIAGLFRNAFAQEPVQLAGPRSPRVDEIAAAEAALLRLMELEAGHQPEPGQTWDLPPALLFDPVLVEQKAMLKAYPPVKVRCAKGHHLEWIAAAPFGDHGLQLSGGPTLQPRKQRQGGAADIRSGTLGGRSALGTVARAEDGAAGVGNVSYEPDGAHGKTWGSKLDYKCRTCPYRRTVLGVSLLRLWLQAVERDDREIDLALLDKSATYVARLADRGPVRAWTSRGVRRRT